MTHFIKTIVTGLILLLTISNVQSQAVFTLEDVTTGTGSSFCMEVTAENLTDAFAIQFSINWDPALLDLTGVNSLNPLVSGANVNTTGSSSGVTTFSFFGGPITIPANEVFFELCFDVLGTNGGSTDVNFTGNPTPIEVATFANPNLGLTTQGGQVTFPTPLIYSMPDTLQAPGATFCMPVAVENFNNLDGFQCAISWDPNVIQFDSVTGFNLSDLDGGSFGTAPSATGLIIFSWNDDDANTNIGVTLPDGTVIFEICYTVVGNTNDNTTIVFSGSDDPFVQVEVIEFGNSTNLGLTSIGGQVNIQQTIFVTNNTITQPNCNDANGGAINISVAGGVLPHTYLWSDTNGSTTQDISGLGVGTYTVTITDSNMPPNEFVSTYNVSGNFTPPIADAGGLDTISCIDPTTVLDGTGSATGTDIIYNWTHNDGTAIILEGNTNTPTVNATGVYTLLVTDAISGCTATDLAIVDGDIVPPLVNAGDADTLNCITTELQLSGTVSPISTYTYSWTHTGGGVVMGNNTLTPDIDQAGIYQLLVTETATGCTAMDTVTIGINTDTPTADAGTTMSISCGDSTVILDGSNSMTGDDITYQWLGVGIVADGNTSTPTVDATGTYTLVVTNSNSQCTAESTVDVNDDFSVPIAVVSDFNPDITCTTQAIPLDGSGSSAGPNFEYLWTNVNGNVAYNETTLNPVVDAGGEYILIVTDTNNGCTATDTTFINEDSNIPIADSGSDRTLDCNTLTVQLDGSESSLGAEFRYLWYAPTPGSFVNNDSTGIAPTVNSGGAYVLEVTDTISNCISISIVNVIMDTIPPVVIIPMPDIISCSQPVVLLEGGLMSIQGNNDLSFSWNTQNGSISGANIFGDIEVNGEGEYCLLVANQSNGCIDSLCVTVDENIAVPNADAGTDIALDCGQTSATLDGTGSSSGNNIIYQWTSLSGDSISNSSSTAPTITSVGEYLIMVTDTINGCMNTSSVMVTQSDDYPIAEAGANQSITCDNPIVTLDASLVSSSGAGYLVEWVGNSPITNPNSLTPTVDAPGPYFLTITNLANNCSTGDQVFVSANNTPPDAVVVQDSVSFGCDLTTKIDGTGSSESFNVEYFWKTTDGNILSGGDSLMACINLGGTYSLLVTNTNNGCVDTATVFVGEPIDAPTIIVFSANITCEFPEVMVDASASTILPNQTFTWTTGPSGTIVDGGNTLTPTVSTQAFYTIIVTDVASGCEYPNSAFVQVDTSIVEVTGIADNDISCQNDLINLTGDVVLTNQFVTFGWTTIDGNITTADTNQLMVQANASGLYQFIAVDSLTGCADTAFVDVMNNMVEPTADAGLDIILDCNSTPMDLDGTGSSVGVSIEYLWTTMNGNITMGTSINTATVNQTGTYILQITDLDNGCIATDTVEVTQSQDVIATAITPLQLDCGVLSIPLDGTGSSTGATITYLWTTTNGTIVGDINSLMTDVSEPGIYTLTVEDSSNGCTSSFDVEVVFDSSFPSAEAGTDATVCEEPYMSSANLPASTTGLWLSQGSAIPASPSDPMSTFTNLQQGENVLIWTLSATGCPEYSSDTIIIFLETAPQANDDSYTMIEGTLLDFNVGVNDIFDTGQFTALTSVGNGILSPLGLDNFSYAPDSGFVGTEQFEYELCSDACPDVCDMATVTININVEEPKPLDSLLAQKTNVITPNGDGKNDNFIFDILLQDADKYPENEFLVFNRWGDLVYEASPYMNDWNGTNKKGKDLSEGTYYYILRLNLSDGIIMEGDITILR